MSNRRNTTRYKITFADEPEVEVYARGISLDKFLSVLQLADQVTSMGDMTPAHAKHLTEEVLPELFGWFTKRVTSWNLEDEEGVPLPVGVEALMGDEDPSFGIRLVMAWVEKISSALGRLSAGGAPLAAASGADAGTPPEGLDLPMTPLQPG